jgi:hypothetical protein
MSKGSREERAVEFFEMCDNLVVARAILRACTETLEKREREARGDKPKTKQSRKRKTNSAGMSATAIDAAREQAGQQPPF